MVTNPPSDLTRTVVQAAVEQLDEGLVKIEHCAGQLTSEQFWWRPAESMNSIANLVLHLSGNLHQWLVTGLTGAEDTRQRQQEFDDRSGRSSAQLLGQLRATITEARRVISDLPADELVRVRHVQQFDVTGIQTIFDSVSHFRGHVQEIIHLTRIQLGDAYQFHFVPEQPTQPSIPAATDDQSAVERDTPSGPLISSLLAEFRRHKQLADSALEQLDDEQFFRLHGQHVNSIALIVKHLAGNLASRWTNFLTSDGEKENRNRDGEFIVTDRDSRHQLTKDWETGWNILFDAVENLSTVDLDRLVTIRGEPHTVFQAIVRGLAHAAYHTGQIVYLRRLMQPDAPWLTIAPGQSLGERGSYLK